MLIFLASLATLSAADSPLYLTGILQVGALKRALVFDASSGSTLILSLDRDVAGLRLLELDPQAGKVLLQRGGQTLSLELPKSGEHGTIAAALTGGELALDFEGAWPPGYEPDIIRRHKARMLRENYENSLPAGQRASRRYLNTIKQYASGLPAEERAAFYNDYIAHVDNAPAPESALKPPSEPTPVAQNAPTLTGSALLQHLMTTQAPEIGSLDGGPAYLAELRRLLQQPDETPAMRRRILQEIYGNSPWLRPPES